MPRILDARVVREVQRKLLRNGAATQRTFAKSHVGPGGLLSKTVVADLAGNCLSPVTVELHGRAETPLGKRTIVVQKSHQTPAFVEMEVSCRKCANCLARRARHWSYRAKAEWHSSARTWLATLTLSPASVVLAMSHARVAMAKQGLDFEALSEADQFLQLDQFVYGEFQKRMKVLRKNSGAPLRYLAITEAHKSGLPHWHVLVHEVSADKPLSHDGHFVGKVWCLTKKRYLKQTEKGSRPPFWALGFSSYKLVRDATGAGYVCKYLNKDIRARVRASKNYGKMPDLDLPPLGETSSERVITKRRKRE